MTAPDLTLNEVKKTAETKDVVYRVQDFLSTKEIAKLRAVQAERSAMKRRGFDAVDAISAEILARFGWNAWQAWQNGQIPVKKMNKMLLAERARQRREIVGLESLIVASVAGANNPTKGGHAPRSLKKAIQILKSEEKLAKGVNHG